jgi:hypothetical protein
MAEKQEGGKPNEFFVGVVDLFAILMPGALLALIVQSYTAAADADLTSLPNEGAAGWAAFLVAAYILGHFVFAVGSLLLDHLYDVSYSKWFHVHTNRVLIDQVKAKLGKSFEIKRYVKRRPLQWSSAFTRVQSASAATEIDRAEADSKFFRSLSTLQFLSWPLLISKSPQLRFAVVGWVLLLILLIVPNVKRWRDRLEKKYTRSITFASFVGVLGLTIAGMAGFAITWRDPKDPFKAAVWALCSCAFLALSIWRFMETRLKRTTLTYEYYLTLSTFPRVTFGAPGGEGEAAKQESLSGNVPLPHKG